MDFLGNHPSYKSLISTTRPEDIDGFPDEGMVQGFILFLPETRLLVVSLFSVRRSAAGRFPVPQSFYPHLERFFEKFPG